MSTTKMLRSRLGQLMVESLIRQESDYNMRKFVCFAVFSCLTVSLPFAARLDTKLESCEPVPFVSGVFGYGQVSSKKGSYHACKVHLVRGMVCTMPCWVLLKEHSHKTSFSNTSCQRFFQVNYNRETGLMWLEGALSAISFQPKVVHRTAFLTVMYMYRVTSILYSCHQHSQL